MVVRTSQASQWPRVKGFRQRGLDMTRIETFTDAAFAFALTMLVISFDKLPNSFADFQLALKNIPAFAASFAQISLFWYGHHVWSRRYGLDDLPTGLLSLTLVFVTLIYVFPLRVIFSSLFDWISGGWFPFMFDDPIRASELAWIFFVYGLGFAAMSYLLALLYWHAGRQAGDLQLDVYERFTTTADAQGWAIVGSVGLLSAVFAIAAPTSIAPFAGFVYTLLAVVMPWFGYVKDQQGNALLQEIA